MNQPLIAGNFLTDLETGDKWRIEIVGEDNLGEEPLECAHLTYIGVDSSIPEKELKKRTEELERLGCIAQAYADNGIDFATTMQPDILAFGVEFVQAYDKVARMLGYEILKSTSGKTTKYYEQITGQF